MDVAHLQVDWDLRVGLEESLVLGHLEIWRQFVLPLQYGPIVGMEGGPREQARAVMY